MLVIKIFFKSEKKLLQYSLGCDDYSDDFTSCGRNEVSDVMYRIIVQRLYLSSTILLEILP